MARPTGPGGRKVLHLEAEAKKDRLLERLLQGALVTEALAEIGVSEGAYRQWRKRDELFAAELDSVLNGTRQFKDGSKDDWTSFADFRLKFFGHHTPPHQQMMVQALEEAEPGDITMILVFPESGKALALGTPLPTPTGWTTMGAVEVGDELIATDGTVTVVDYKSPVWLKPTYRVTLDDGSEFVACEDHRWLVRQERQPARVFTTKELAEIPADTRLQIPLVAPFEGVPADLPIHPYVLGVWLGDGHSKGARFTCADLEIVERVRACGYEVTDTGNHNCGRAHIYGIQDNAERAPALEKARRLIEDEGYSYAAAAKATGLSEGFVHHSIGPIEGRYVGCRPRVTAQHVEAVPKLKFFGGKLQGLGVWGAKHIPMRYLRAPIEDRLELLRGLMDTDGTCSKRGRASIGLSDRRLADDVIDLLCGLGFKPMVSTQKTTHKDSYRIDFCTDERDVFTLPRKLERQSREGLRDRRIVAIEEIEPQPTQCLQVSHPSHSFAIGRRWVHGLNTTLFEDYACYKLATDPTWRTTIGTEAQGLARRIVGRIKNRLEVDGPFPQLVSAFGPFAPQRNDGRATQQVWAQDFFNVYKRKASDQRDYNVVGIGFGSQIAGTRTDHLHCDDLQSMKSLNQTQKMFETFQQDWLSRPGEHGKTTINGTRVGDGDIYEAIEEAFSGKSFFRLIRLPAVIVDHATGEKRPLWPYDPKTKSGYTMKQLDRMREKVGESAWARNYMQKPRSKSLGTWTEDIVDRCLNGERIYGQDTLPVPGAPVYIGLDPALGGINCLMALQITGTKLYILDIQEDEKLARNEDIMIRLEAMIVNVKARGGHVTDVIIEAMNFQRGLARDERLKELAERHAFSAREHMTGVNKYDADIGVPSMVSSFIRREIDIPNGDDDRTREVTSQLRNQLLRWRPGARGSVLRQDQVMALWFVWVVWQSRRKVVDEARTNFVSDALPWKPTTSGLLVPAGGASPFYKR